LSKSQDKKKMIAMIINGDYSEFILICRGFYAISYKPYAKIELDFN